MKITKLETIGDVLNFTAERSPGEKVIVMLNGSELRIEGWEIPVEKPEPVVVPLSSVHAGRVNVLDASFINPTVGRAVKRRDGKTALFLKNVTAAQTITAELADGNIAEIPVVEIAQPRGHPDGAAYWLPKDRTNKFVGLHSEVSRDVYVTYKPTGLTLTQIATQAGVPLTAVTGEWLDKNRSYGATPETALSLEAFKKYFSFVHGENKLGRADHYFLERGGHYSHNFFWASSGESEIRPMMICAYGEGTPPTTSMEMNWSVSPYTVVQDVELGDGARNWYSYAIAFDHVKFAGTFDASNSSFVTFHETETLDASLDEPKAGKSFIGSDGQARWTAHGNHTNGIYASNADHILIHGAKYDKSGWREGYDYQGLLTHPHPPFKYAHNIYFSTSVFDSTIRHSSITRAASDGTQLRSGLHIEGNLFAENNLLASINSTAKGHFNNILDNVGYSTGYKRIAYEAGAYNWGYIANGPLTSLKGNILAHHKNPDDPSEAHKLEGLNSVNAPQAYVNDTQIYKWGPQVSAKYPKGADTNNKNIDDVDTAVLDKTTVHNYIGKKLGKAQGTFDEWIELIPRGKIEQGVKDITHWFKANFGTPIPRSTTPKEVYFEADEAFEGERWDNRYNWNVKEVAGQTVKDDVSLDGNLVQFGNLTTNVANLSFKGGKIDLVSGLLHVDTITDAAEIDVRMAGQITLYTATQPLKINALSGGINLKGTVAKLDIHATGHSYTTIDASTVADKVVLSGGYVGFKVNGKLDTKSLSFAPGISLVIDSGNMGNRRLLYMATGTEIVGTNFRAKVGGVYKWGSRAVSLVNLVDVVGTPTVGDTFTVIRRSEQNVDITETFTVKTVYDYALSPIRGSGELTLSGPVNLEGRERLKAGTYVLSQGVRIVDNGAVLAEGFAITDGVLKLTI